MDASRLSIWQTLLPVAPFLAVILAPNLVFLDVTGRIEHRPTTVTIRSADGSVVSESKQKDIKIVDLRWRLGPYILSSTTKTESVFKIESGFHPMGAAVKSTLSRMRSWITVAVFPIAFIVSMLIGRAMRWHSRPDVPNVRSYSPSHVTGTCLVIFCILVISFALMKPWWSAGVRELAWWLRLSVAGVAPFVSIVIITPIAEEMFFRSGACRLLVERLGPAAGILLQAMLFGSVHLATPLHIAVGFAGGIVLGIVYVYCRSLQASILLHAGANGALAVACLTVA